MERSRHFFQQKRRRSAIDPLGTWEKVRIALKGMGFPDAQARHAVAEVERRHSDVPTIEQALREAVLAATASLSR